MKDLMNNTVKLAIKYAKAVFVTGFLLSSSVQALTVSENKISVSAGGVQTVKLSGISGKITVTNSAPGIVVISNTDDSTYKFSGVAAGNATVLFKDRKSTAKVNVTVTASSAAILSGRLLASNCFQCHGTNGGGGFDKLAGKSAREIYKELKEFSTGAEDPDGIMAAHAAGFSDAQLLAIANYFSSQR